MQSTSHHYFGKFLNLSLRVGIGFVIFCAVTSVFLAALGWLQISLPLWTGAVVGLLMAFLFDRLVSKSFDWPQLEVWQDAPAWKFVTVLGAFGVVLAVATKFMLEGFSGDPLCHHGITKGMLAFGVPARDLGSPDRFLPYHALGNLLAASLASGIGPDGSSSAVEASLDIVSLTSLAIFLAIATVFFVLLSGVFASLRRPGPLWFCLVYPLLVLGSGPVVLAHLMPDVLNSADSYPVFGALAFHPLLQYLGRRSAVAAFAIFVVLLCTLLLCSRGSFSRRVVPLVVMTACFIALSYSSLDLFLSAVFVVIAGLLFRDLRRTALLGVAALLAAAPFIAVQGGFFTASLLNSPLPDARSFFAWELRAPSLVGFFLGNNLAGIPLSEPFALKVLAVELPWFLLSIPAACWLLLKEMPSASRSWTWIIMVLALVKTIAPFFVFFVFSPWDLHRLFFWPMLFAAILTPFALQLLRNKRGLAIGVVAVLLLVSCNSALLRVFLRAPNEVEGELGRAAQDFRERLGFDPAPGITWIASAGVQNLLFMNGCRVLAPPFGAAGPVYYQYPPLLLDGFVQNWLALPDTGGATMALLTGDDLDFLRRKRAGGLEILNRLDVAKNEGQIEIFVVRLPSVASSN